MPVLSITVSLSEVLEVRAGPLTDAEIWALLCQAAETLQDIFLAGESRCENIPAFVINPDTIYLTSMGQVEFASTQKVQQYANYMAPDTEEENMLTDAATEQVYVFALGKSLIYSSEYGLKSDEPVRISESLESLLRRMTNRNSSQRISLLKVMEACGIQKKSCNRGLDRSFSQTVTNLYQTVLGQEGQSEENMETYTNTTSHQNISPRELIVDRSRRKQKKSRDSRRRKHSSPEQYRSRSRTRSRSRSHSKHKDTGRRSDSPDSGYHRTSPLPKTMHSRSGDENHSRTSRPELLTTDYDSGRSYHLSDITFSASQNGHTSHKSLAASSHHHSRPSSRTSANPKDIDNPVFKKYLKLKERQRKLRALRHDAMSDEASDELSDIVMDHMSETRSVRSIGSRNVGEFGGVYHPDLHMHYGSKSALKIGRDSDRESVVSSDNSAYGPDHQPFRAAGDISDPYIEHLQKVSAAKPPQLPTFDKPEPTSKQKKKPPSPRQLKPRDFYGPEFMHRSTKPIQRIPIALQGESRKNPGRVCRVVIVLLNGQKMEAMVDPSTTGQQLFEAVVTEIELPEFYFFGLTYVNDNEHFFITGDTKLHKIAPEGWKESWKREAAPITFSVYLRVKFYIENLHALKHETSRHQLYLQLRRDILEERCQCDEERAMTLAGLAMQAEYGDYNKDTMGRNYFSPEHYFSGQMVKRLGTGYLKDHAPETHKQLSGLTEVEAQMEFIQFVQENLPEYGIHFHKLLKEKKGKTADIIWVGINMDHLVLSEDSAGQRIMVHQYPWSAIQKISFNRRRFSVQPRPEISQMKPFKMNFYTNSYKKGQYLLKFCTAQHSFQLKIKTRLATHDGMPDLSQEEHMSIGDTEDMGSVHSEDEHTITDEVESKDVQEVEMATGGFSATDHVPQKHPTTYRNPPPYRPETSASMIDLPVSARDTNIVPVRHVPRSATTNNVNQESQASTGNPAVLEDNAVSEEDIEAQIVQPAMAYVIDTSTRSTDRTLFPRVENETISNTLHQRFTNDLLSPEHSICEQDIFEVTLNKHPSLGIGITIVGGDISSKHDFGIFVKSVTVDGPAFQDGRIKPGDRLIAINDQNLEGMQHHEAVTLIKESGDSVRLLISQVRPPGSLKRRDDADLDIDDDPDGETNIEAEKLSVRTHKGDKEEPKSFAESAERSDSPNVHNVQSCSSVYKDGNLNKSASKKLQNDKNNEKNVDPVNRKSSIPDIGSAAVDQDRPLSATVDAHSTFSEVESLYSEMSVSKLPKDLQDDSDAVCDSDTDSDFDDVVNKVIENTYRPARNNATTRNREMDVDSDSEEAEQFEVFLEKQNGSFGLNVTGGVNTSVRHGGIYVKSVMKDSAADRNGSIRKGDRILEVDGECLEGFTHKQAVQALCRAPPRCALKLQRSSRSRTSSSSSHMSSRSACSLQNNAERLRTENRKDNSDLPEDIYGIFVTEENTYTVDLTKGSYGLGFSTVGGHLDQHASLEERVVRIKRVFPIGPAADSRAIHSGDVILAVNGYSVAGLSHTETMSRLRGAGKQVQLLLCHPDPDQLPPLMHLESEESLEITPTDSANNVTDTESDSDSDLEVTPRREALITPPSGFALSPYPKDEDGLVMPKIASPPPLPISPPPTLLSTTGSGDSDTPRGEEIEVQIGVAELMDSCRSEMVLIHNAKKNASAQQLFNGSLVVREDSAVTLNSRDVTPVVLESSGEVSPVVLESSREATPCVNVADDITQADNTESETEESEIEDETNELAKSETVSKSHTQNLEITSTLTSTYQSNGSHNDDPEETDNDLLTRTDLSTSVNIDRPEIVKLNGKSILQYEQADDIETSLVNTGTYTVEQANRDMNRIRDVLDGAIVNKNTLEKNVHNKESLYLNKDYVQISQNVDEISSDSDEETSEEDQDSDADIKRLEEKYIELQNEEDNGDEDSNYDDEEDDDNKIEGDDANNSVNNSRNNYEENTDIINLDQDQQDISKSINDVYDVDDADDNKNEDDDDEEEEFEEDNSDNNNISDNEDEKDNNNGDDDDSNDDSEKENTTERTQFARRENNENSLQNSESPVIRNAEDEIEHDMRDESDESISDHSLVRESLSPTLETQSLNPGEFEVTLTKPEGRGLGFTLAGGAKTTGGCYVKAVLQNPALSDGNLKPGDKLIMVNGIDMRPLNHFEAVSVLRETQDEVTIRVYRAELAGEDTGQAGVDNFPTSRGLAALGIISDQPYDDGNEQDSLRSITSEGSYTDGDDSGALQDLIASLEESLDQARISNTQPDNSGNQTENVWRDKSVKETRSPRASRSTPTAEASVYEIDLEKPVGGGLGISLVTAQTQNQTGIFISTITPGGVADLDGRLQVGDKILRINGESLIGMNHTKAATMLRSSQGQLSLTVSRKGRKPVLMESSEDLNRSRSISDLEGHSENEGEGDSSDAKVNAKKGDCEDGEELENDDSLRDVSDVNASLSITQHVQSDIEDDDVDDLVNKAEHVLGDAKVYSDSESDINDSDLRDEVTAKKAHQYLSASEVIDYHSQEIDEDTEQENDPVSSKGMTGNEQEPDSETQDLDKSAIEGEIQVYSDKCWCNLLRSLDIVVPDEVTADWLLNLSLVTVPDNMKAALVNIVSNLQEKIDKDDPNEEFKQLRNVPSTDDCTAATMPHNRPKNRFRNVLPFDVNRVKISDDEETDYINASYVQLEVGDAVCDYIVCQGPLPETTDDFWGMIWQEEVTVIAMLTLDMEAMKVKCHRYWPDTVDTPIEVCGGKLRLSLLYQNSLEDFDIRSILVEDLESGDNRCVYHLNYTTWPDHGTPASAVPLLQCMRLCHLYRSSGPVVVHCSAGIGRSGTFITIDVALAHVELGYEFDILEIVQELRRQRQGMIQTRDQYTFCYTALVEVLTDTPS